MEIGTTIVLADAHAMLREGLKLALETTSRMSIVGETGSMEDAVRLSRRLGPDVLAIDSELLRGSALSAIRKLRARQPTTRVLVLTDPGCREPMDGIT